MKTQRLTLCHGDHTVIKMVKLVELGKVSAPRNPATTVSAKVDVPKVQDSETVRIIVFKNTVLGL